MCHVQRAELALDPQLARRTLPSESRSRACRTLFGPVDHEELGRELQRRLREMQEESCRRWGFDFQEGVPLAGTGFAWEETEGHSVPDFYRDTDCAEPPGPPAQGHIPRLEVNEGSPEKNPPNTALTASTASKKRPPNTGLITDFYPVRKKTKDVKALCDKMYVESAVLKEQTPQDPLR